LIFMAIQKVGNRRLAIIIVATTRGRNQIAEVTRQGWYFGHFI